MKVIDNFLEQNSFNQFKDIITSQNFPWYFNDEKVLNDNSLDNFQFVNIFQQGNTANFLLDVFKEKLKVSNFLRAKLSLCRSFTDEVFEQPSAAINATKHFKAACCFITCFLWGQFNARILI